MIFKRHHFVILGLWLFWLSVFLWWQWQFREFPAWRWLVVGLAILFFAASMFLLGAARHKERSHPLVDEKRSVASSTLKETEQEPAELAQEDFTPTKEADWYQWRDAYYMIILPFLQANKSKSEIVEEMRVKGFPASKYVKIRRAGEMGLLGEFSKGKAGKKIRPD